MTPMNTHTSTPTITITDEYGDKAEVHGTLYRPPYRGTYVFATYKEDGNAVTHSYTISQARALRKALKKTIEALEAAAEA